MKNRRNAIYALLVVSLAGGLLSGRTFFFHMTYVFGFLLAASFLWAWFAVNWVRIGRQTFARRAQVGRVFDERFTVQNTGYLPKLWLEVRDQSTLPGHNASHVVPTLFQRRKYQWKVETICTKRGQFTLGPLTLNSGDPFGLFQFPRHIAATSKVIVYPATVPLYEFAAPMGKLSGGQAVRRRTMEVTTNASGVRDYAPGDSLNRIHWKTTARRGKFFVKDFELDPLSDVWLFLDLDRSAYVEAPDSSGSVQAGGAWRLPANTEEYCVTCAASISEYFIDKGRGLGFVAYTPFREVIQPDRGDRQLTRILRALALAKSETSFTLAQLLAVEGHLLGRDNTLVLVTATGGDAWLGEAEQLKRRGLHVITVLVNAVSLARRT
ncbi:MAG: DUF58 domain-containing protein [Anaerolineae bacterium]|nr:DUF58 domain-containing protein [Anaerolineae bacterium]